MHDDLVPEEEKLAYNQLLTTLRSSSPGHETIATHEQTQITAQVRERLMQATVLSTPPAEGDVAPNQRFVFHAKTRRMKKSTRLAANLLAALVVIGLILGSWTLFRTYPRANVTTTVSKASTEIGATARTQANGLEASMHVLIGGPYFLSELLTVSVSLTNHTQKALSLDGTAYPATVCFFSALMAEITQGNDPSFSVPVLAVPCIQPAYVTTIKPGHTLTILQYVPVTKNGEVTLAMQSLLFDKTLNPLSAHWPTIHLQVNQHIPQDRTLSLQHQPGQVTINAPADAQVHLLYMQTINCDSYYGPGVDQWTPLATNVLDEPACPTAHPQWEYMLSAPGYTIVSGSQTN